MNKQEGFDEAGMGKERLNSWPFAEYAWNIFALLVRAPFWLAQLLFFFIPLKDRRIIIYSLKQHGYSCNLKYLTERLRNEADCEVLWIVRRPEDAALVRGHGIPVAMLHSKEHFLYRMRAKVVITNDEFYNLFLKRRKQLYINTWHGGINYKNIGYTGIAFANPIQRLLFHLNNPRPDCFVSGSRLFTETTAKAFRFPEDIFLPCGLPRNDPLCGEAGTQSAAWVKERLGIAPGEKVLLYAPTFRKGGHGPAEELDYTAVRACLRQRFGGEWVVLVRQHYFVDGGLSRREAGVIDVSGYEDTQELLLCSDCLISDYSSCMWDYLLTGRPCFVFAPDLDGYARTDRAFAVPVERWPYPVSINMEELRRQITAFDPQTFARRVAEHRAECGAYDRGNASETLAKYILNKM